MSLTHDFQSNKGFKEKIKDKVTEMKTEIMTQLKFYFKEKNISCDKRNETANEGVNERYITGDNIITKAKRSSSNKYQDRIQTKQQKDDNKNMLQEEEQEDEVMDILDTNGEENLYTNDDKEKLKPSFKAHKEKVLA